jgi:hypothetical protein
LNKILQLSKLVVGQVFKLNSTSPHLFSFATVCGLSVMIAGDAVLYYPAQSNSSPVVHERGHLSAAEIFLFGLLMTLIAFVVVLIVAIPYGSAVGEPLL